MTALGLLLASVVTTARAAAPAAHLPVVDGVTHWGAVFQGSGNQDRVYRPRSVVLPGPVVEVATSNSSEYALLSNGQVWAWGLGSYGQLGDGARRNEPETPVQVQFPPGISIAFLPTDAMPRDTGLAVDTQGNVWGWGFATGALCQTDATRHLTPFELPLHHVTEIAGAGDHALYDAGGTVYACGANGSGDLGDGQTAASNRPVVVDLPAGAAVRSLVAGYEDSGALLEDGTYYDWGYNAQGQLGDGSLTDSDVPVPVVGLPLPVVQVAQGGSDVGNGQTLAMLADGSLWAWGDGSDGQLGDGRDADEALPVRFSPPAGVTFATLGTGAVSSYAISTTGDVYSWGRGALGQLGDGQQTGSRTPVLVETGATGLSTTANVVVTRGEG